MLAAGVAQLVSALPSVLEVPSSILSDSNVCFDFALICAPLALNTRKTMYLQRKGKVKDYIFDFHWYQLYELTELPPLNKGYLYLFTFVLKFKHGINEFMRMNNVITRAPFFPS